MLLPVAYRSLSRLSSALSAKASTLRSYSLNQQLSNSSRSYGCYLIYIHSVVCLVFFDHSYYCHNNFLCLHFRFNKHNLLYLPPGCLIIFDFSIRFSRFTSWYSFVPSGDGEIRTLDPLLARQVLSQLSYAPELVSFFLFYWA